METSLKRLFDFQRFAKNPALQSVIDRVEAQYDRRELSDEELETLAAAGDPYLRFPGGKEQPR